MQDQSKSVVIEFKGRITLDVSFDEDDIEKVNYHPGEQIYVTLIPTKFPDNVTIQFEDGSYAFNISVKLFKVIEE